jgi:hypothetical protein
MSSLLRHCYRSRDRNEDPYVSIVFCQEEMEDMLCFELEVRLLQSDFYSVFNDVLSFCFARLEVKLERKMS